MSPEEEIIRIRAQARARAQSTPFTDAEMQANMPPDMVLDPNTGSYTNRELMSANMRPNMAQSAVAGGASGSSFGWIDELAGLLTGSNGEFYKEKARALIDAARREHKYTTGAAEIGGAISSGVGLGSAGLTVMAPGQTLPVAMAAGAAEGAGYGGLTGAGYADDGSKVQGAATGAVLGAATGGAIPPVLKAGGAGLKSVGGMVGIGNDARAKAAIAEALRRSGRTLPEVTDEMAKAARQGQPEYMMADALGNSGRRMLSGVVRSPGDARQRIYETLMKRQSGQSDRLMNALSEGFDAPDTATARAAGLKAVRDSQANTNYMLAREGAGAVDPSQAIAQADEFLTPGVTAKLSPQSNIADDSIEAAVRKARSYLTDGQSVVSDFNTAFRAKQELDNLIEGAKPTVQRQLIPIRNALDDALEAASPNYAIARNTYRAQSKAIDAVDVGKKAASGRVRSQDSIPQFQAMSPDEQSAFRAGYADPYLTKIEGASLSPTTNKARSLVTAKTGEEFPAFAAPGKAEVLGDRIARENSMFETANAALGGSRTADNLADIMDVQTFDPTMLGAVASGNMKGAILHALTKSGNFLEGRNQQTRDLIAQMLLETDASKAMVNVAGAVKRGDTLSTSQKALIRALSSQIGGNNPLN